MFVPGIVKERKTMTPQDEQMIQQAPCFKTNPPPTIIFVKDRGSTGVSMARFCDEIKALVPEIRIKKDSDLPFPAPALVIGRHQNIGYQAAPTGKMLTYFLGALGGASDHAPEFDPQVEDRLRKIDLPVILKLYVASQCPNCPQSIRQLQALATHCPLIRLRIIDAQGFPQASEADQVRSVPTLILDDQFRWTGIVKTEELLALCIQRDPSQLSADSLRQLVEAGDAARVAEMMAAAGRLFPALVELLVNERWSVRLGAMVTAEYLADAAPALSLQLCELLWERFARLSPPVQGDVVQVLGQINTDVTRGYLSNVVSGAYVQDVKTAAAEVLEEMGDLSSAEG
jgi:thiol-disulfide isomerase/thioredoxin